MATEFGKLGNFASVCKEGASDVSRVLRQTYQLLSATLGVTAIAALVSQQLHLPHPGVIVTLVGFYGLLFLIHKSKDSAKSILFTFLLAAFMGYTLGPVLNSVLQMQNGGTLVGNAFLMTAVAFLGLSGFVTRTGKDMSFLGSFMLVGFLVLLCGMVAAWLFHIPGLHLALSVGFVLFSSAAILYETSQIVRGGQNNYVLATVSLYVSIYNLFLSLLNLLRSFSGED